MSGGGAQRRNMEGNKLQTVGDRGKQHKTLKGPETQEGMEIKKIQHKTQNHDNRA